MSQTINLNLQIQPAPKTGPGQEPNVVEMTGLQQVTLDVSGYTPEVVDIKMTAAGFLDNQNLIEFLEMSLGVLKRTPTSHKAIAGV